MILPLLLFFAVAPEQDVEDSVKKLIDVLTTMQAQAADPVSTEQALYGGAIPGMLRRLDPHSVFFDPQQFEQLKQMERGENKGFGSIVSVLPGRVIMLQALPGTPSAKSGLSPGDEILAINNVRLASLSFEQLIEFLGESRRHTVSLAVRRPGNARLMIFTLNPELVDTPSLDRAYFLKPDIGYIRVASFDPQTGKLLKQAIEKLGGANLKGLVLDLRNNPGGVVDAALQSASLFLQPGQEILSIKGRHVKGEDVQVPKTATPYTFPIAILINEKTASAAEIVTGALQDHDRAVVIGIPSYGKGLVQTVMPLSSNTGLALTTAFYYTPSGRSIQKPLQTGQLEFAKSPQQYKTDAGRSVIGGGGIQPDFIVQPEGITQLRAVLEASGIFTAFATEYLQAHKIADGFHVTGSLLDDFQLYASQHSIQPPISEWISDRDWIQNRLEQEIVNQSLGVAKGDEVEARRDPAIRTALEKLAK
jgi:carboxyl-terminal processing protease